MHRLLSGRRIQWITMLAALVLARAGVRVRLVDRTSFPRFKLCGDTLNPGALSILRQLDEPTALRVLAHALPIEGMIVTGPAGARVAADYQADVRGVAIARADLDLMLLEAAIAALRDTMRQLASTR